MPEHDHGREPDPPKRSDPPLIAWGGFVATIATLLISGTVAFCKVEARCDLNEQAIEHARGDADQKFATYRAERDDLRKQRDTQMLAMSGRCDTLERNFGDVTRTLTEVTAKLAVVEARQADQLELLRKIDARMSGDAAGRQH